MNGNDNDGSFLLYLSLIYPLVYILYMVIMMTLTMISTGNNNNNDDDDDDDPSYAFIPFFCCTLYH